MTAEPDPRFGRRLPGVDDATVDAVGAVSEALEWVERARGHLYSFHQLMGHADMQLGQTCDKLRDAGHDEIADRLSTDMVGRNVLPGRWTFQIVEEFDDHYWAPLRTHEHDVRDRLQQGRRHVLEAEMKEQRRTHDRPGEVDQIVSHVWRGGTADRAPALVPVCTAHETVPSGSAYRGVMGVASGYFWFNAVSWASQR